jgi:ABC-type antimicrobial peptide transport system permease subunit
MASSILARPLRKKNLFLHIHAHDESVATEKFQTVILSSFGGGPASRDTHWVRSMLYQTSSVDPGAIGLSVAVLTAAALLASLLPARRAASVDPIHVLRSE